MCYPPLLTLYSHAIFFLSKLLSLIESRAFSAKQVVKTRLEMQQCASTQTIIEMLVAYYTLLHRALEAIA